MSIVRVFFISTFVVHCICTPEPACDASDGGDTCEFLQGPVGVTLKGAVEESEALEKAKAMVHHSGVKDDKEDKRSLKQPKDDKEEVKDEKRTSISAGAEENAIEERPAHQAIVHHYSKDKHLLLPQGLPEDWLKQVGDFINSGLEGLHFEDAVEALQKAVEKFVRHTKRVMKELARGEMSFDKMQLAAAEALDQISDNAVKVSEKTAEVQHTFAASLSLSLGKLLPKDAFDFFDNALHQVAVKSAGFASTMEWAETVVLDANETTICDRLRETFERLENEGKQLLESVTGLSFEKLAKGMKAVDISNLPEKLRKEIEKVIEEIDKAAKTLIHSLPSVVKDVKEGMQAAFRDVCTPKKSNVGLPFGLSALLFAVAFWLL